MNMQTPISRDPITTRTPGDLELTVRDRRFGRGSTPEHWWLAGDPVGTAWFNSLSASFPRGEAFFIEAVKAHREGAPPRLLGEIREFVAQEINHSREHVAFNRAATDAGYDLSAIDRKIADWIDETRKRPAIVNLAATMALEHFTAMFAHEFLANPRHFAGARGDSAALWRWHAIEEIEHKAVAYDTWLHATRDWSRWKRWKVKSLTMLLVSMSFVRHRSLDALALMKQDGLTGWRMNVRLAAYLVGKPGMLRRIFPQWVSYFLPGFHPWNHDDRALIAAAESELNQAA